MNQEPWLLPGTVLEADPTHPESAEELFGTLFLGGGLVLSQVAQITGLEPHTIQNWVKRGFLAPPEKKKYTFRQLSRIMIIHMLKSSLRMEQICSLIGYINGQLDDESDDSIDDSRLYLYFVRLAAEMELNGALPESTIAQLLEDYDEPVPEARVRIAAVLQVMLDAWQSTRYRQRAEARMSALGL